MRTDPHNCGDCAARPGEPHTDGCDVARCLETGEQRLQCDGLHVQEVSPGCYVPRDCGRDIWTGTWPGEAECIEFGWYSVFTSDGWRRCGAEEPGAGPDLNRLHAGEADWDRAAGRWVKMPWAQR